MGDIDYVPLSTSKRDDEFRLFHEFQTQMICLLYRVSPELLSHPHASGVAKLQGVGVSAPKQTTTRYVDDPSGDDVARDLTNEELRAFAQRQPNLDGSRNAVAWSGSARLQGHVGAPARVPKEQR